MTASTRSRLEPAGQLAGMRLHLHRIGSAHERVMGSRDRADDAVGGELVQPVEREDDVPIFLKPGAVEVDRDMADQQVVRLACRRGSRGNRRRARGTGLRRARRGRPRRRSRPGAAAGPARSPTGVVAKSGHSSSARRFACAGGKSVNRVMCTSRERPVSFNSGTGKSDGVGSGMRSRLPPS